MKVYYFGPTRSRRVLWTLEELGVPYEAVRIDYPPREKEPSYLSINPVGTLPALVDGPVQVTESMAICQYVAQKHGEGKLTVSADAKYYADYLQFISYGEAMLTQPLGLVVRYEIRAPENRRFPQVAQDAREIFKLRLEAVRLAVRDREYIAGDQLTLADISVGYALGLAHFIGAADLMPTEVQRYHERLSSRAAYQRAAALT
jgi:glutathione S-transferase